MRITSGKNLARRMACRQNHLTPYVGPGRTFGLVQIKGLLFIPQIYLKKRDLLF
jgi:hypothetical protein